MASSGPDGILADVRSWTWLHWTGVVLSIGLAAVNIFVGYAFNQFPLIVVGCSFLAGVGLFFTRFWQPILYLLGVLHVMILGVLWLLSGMPFFEWGVVTGVLSVGLAGIALYLFFTEQPASEPSSEDANTPNR